MFYLLEFLLIITISKAKKGFYHKLKVAIVTLFFFHSQFVKEKE